NEDIFIDSEVLLYDIDDEIKYFVQTDIFNKCIEVLETQRKILLSGDPGVGKTQTSKMILLKFVKDGYRVRYTSNGDLTELKKSVTSNKDVKEVILLDDCLGQHYFNFRRGHDKELLSLIKHVDKYKNKVLILNSRVTILNEALNTFEELKKYFGSEKLTLRKINMNKVSMIEKAKIFHTMLKRNKVSNVYYNSVRKNKNYLRIIEHKNFNPRVLEYVTLPGRLRGIPGDSYFEFIMENLNNPKDIWKNEFEHRIKYVDRIFMFTLYSLTNTYVSKEVLENCFDYIISKDSQLDATLYNFESTLERLNRSMVKIVDSYGEDMVGVLNPSINDYMKTNIFKNKLLLQFMKDNSIYLNQLERLCSSCEFENILKRLVSEDRLFEYNTIYREQLFDICLHTIAENKIFNEGYISNMELLVTMNDHTRLGNYSKDKAFVVKNFIQDLRLRDFYEIEKVIFDVENIERLFNNMNIEETAFLMDSIIDFLRENRAYSEEISKYLEKKILSELEFYVEEFDYEPVVDNWCDLNLQDEVFDEDYESIIEEIQEDIESLIGYISNEVMKLNIINHFKSLEETIKLYIDDVFEEMHKESSNSPEEQLTNINMGIDDILNRSI